ncbi:hypothetical protein SAMD00019534_000780 [Acytostelium subglobosum LB1]|uniref:hypothetical protein n=1 Tax=Acytostelium subglobosum LB1 TaxID=1410327 RepID=UPI000644EF05|nr:hypothetical protein SAMD00019534_000780 [Acytostelium subglobosum LB1]GAM16903.1 hypothetical protein SAMD00019534_000780 [Acytostelium subglobosum LB1]|eukprot:XP_012758965.1 hypothetical protein SAMD00019534_000780 [Acytostelium subglobosum LB1]
MYDGDGHDDVKKKRIRQMQNRQSAAQYRERKKDYLDKLEAVVEKLESERNQLIANTEKLTMSQSEVNMKIAQLEEKIDHSLKKNRELKSTLAQLAKSTGVAMDNEQLLVQDVASGFKPIAHTLPKQQHLPQQQVKSPGGTFHLAGNRSILNNGVSSTHTSSSNNNNNNNPLLLSDINSPSSSSASSSPIHNTVLGDQLQQQDRYIDKFNNISISNLSVSDDKGSRHLPSISVIGSGGSVSGGGPSMLSTSMKHHHHQQQQHQHHHQHQHQHHSKRYRDFSLIQGDGSMLSASLAAGNNSPCTSLYVSTSPTPSQQHPLSFSPLPRPLPQLSNSHPSSFTPPLASFSSILSITSPSSSPIHSSLSSSPSNCYFANDGASYFPNSPSRQTFVKSKNVF